MEAKLQKLSANKDTKDSIQFQLSEDQTEQHADEILALRRYDFVRMSCESNQATMDDTGTQGFPSFQFQSINTALSLCVTEKGIITTITFSFEDQKVFETVIKHKLRNKIISLSFTEGQNPYSDK